MRSATPPFGVELTRLAPDRWTEPFWAAAREERLVAPRCRDCATFRMPPTGFCPTCRSSATDWVELSGRGTVYTFTVARHALVPGAAPAVPYVIAVVSLEGAEPVRLITNIIDCGIEDAAIGMAVEVVFCQIDASTTLPRFRPAEPLR